MRTIADLTRLLLDFTEQDGIFQSSIAGISIVRSSTPTAPEMVLYEPTLCVVAQGAKEARLDNQTYRYDCGHYLLGSVKLPVIGAVTEATQARPYLCLRIALNTVLLAELVELCDKNNNYDSNIAGLNLGAMDEKLIDVVARLAEMLHSPQHIAVLAPLIEKELTWLLLQQPESYTALAQMVVSDSRLRRIKKAIKWLEVNFTQPVVTSELAAMANMGVSSFHTHFKAVTGTSPLRFRSRLRLISARRLMVIEGYQAAEAGYAVGYKEPAQFSREYAKQFGLPPKQDAIRLQGSFLIDAF
ncbi:AraC family transcriptional regulator N-terminal domain-containing protein [Pseudoalteromonas mariniglutinosa]|uniref:AraC family transcriptional regulator n=1 Tax=Pseudoalteromonas mariniglutinosa TaxID=206042 RepID=UPI0038502C11